MCHALPVQSPASFPQWPLRLPPSPLSPPPPAQVSELEKRSAEVARLQAAQRASDVAEIMSLGARLEAVGEEAQQLRTQVALAEEQVRVGTGWL